MSKALLLALALLQTDPTTAQEAVPAPAAEADATTVTPQAAASPDAAAEANPPAQVDGKKDGAPVEAPANPGAAETEAAPAAVPAVAAEPPAPSAGEPSTPSAEAGEAAPVAGAAPAAETGAAQVAPAPDAAPPPEGAGGATAPAGPAAAEAAAASPPPEVAEPVPAAVPAAVAAGAAASADCAADGGCVPEKKPTRWGLTIDGGFPDAVGIALLYRPWYWLRLEAGGTTTVYASNGYRVGVSLVAFDFGITPTLTFNYGRALEADWNPMLEKFSTPDPDLAPVLQKFGYQYLDAHVGLELGAPRRFVFFLRAGLTQLWTTVHGLTPAAAAQFEDASTSVTVSDSRIAMRVPSLKVGFLLYLF